MLKKVKDYAGKQLRISLNDKSYKAEKINTQVLKDYLGGVAIVQKYFMKD